MKEFSKSMKAKMYDFTYTPFMSSMVIAWIILNHKYILIYMASYDLNKKLDLLKNYDFSLHTPLLNIPYSYNIFLPILFGLFYTFLYPKASKVFYDYTLKRNKELKKLKQKSEEDTPILKEEAIALRKENYDKTEKILELENKITTIRSDYDMELTKIEDDTKTQITNELNSKHKIKLKELQQNYEKEYKEKAEVLEKRYQDAYSSIIEERDTLAKALTSNQTKNAQLIKENKELLKKIPKEFTGKETDKDKILRFFYESNYSGASESTTLDNIFKKTKIPRPKIQEIINDLVNNNILIRPSKSYEPMTISDAGNKFLIKIFDKES